MKRGEVGGREVEGRGRFGGRREVRGKERILKQDKYKNSRKERNRCTDYLSFQLETIIQ